MNKLALTIGKAFKAVGQGWKNMPLQNKLYMGTVITDKLAGKSNFGGLGLAIANAGMDLSGQPRGFGAFGGGNRGGNTNRNQLSTTGLSRKVTGNITEAYAGSGGVSSARGFTQMRQETN